VRVVFVNRYFYPDHSATSQMLADLAFHLASRGWDVGVITSRLRYDERNAGGAGAPAIVDDKPAAGGPKPAGFHPLPMSSRRPPAAGRELVGRIAGDSARPTLPKRETINGVDVRRIWTTRFGRTHLIGRAFDYLTFYISAFFAIRRERRSLIVAMTDPPLLSVVAALAAPNVVNWDRKSVV